MRRPRRAGSETRKSTTGAFEQLSHRIQLLDSARRRSLKRRGRAECNRRVAVSSVVSHGWNGSEIGSAHGQHGEPWHAQPCCFRASTAPGRQWLWTQEAMQAGRFSLKKVDTYSNVSDLTTKHHDEERLMVLMTWERLRYTRGQGDAVSTTNEGQTAAVIAVRRSPPIELDRTS